MNVMKVMNATNQPAGYGDDQAECKHVLVN